MVFSLGNPFTDLMAQSNYKPPTKSSYFVSISLQPKAKYPQNFQHFDYVNPQAPKQGNFVIAGLGSFDSLNPFIIKGESASGLAYLYDTLLVSSDDEDDVRYGLLAEKIFYDERRLGVIFQLRKNARFHDGSPVTADDVVWSFNTITENSPQYKFYYQDVASVRKLSDRRVEFRFKKKNLEMPSILGQLTILPKHYWEGNREGKNSATGSDSPKRDFSKTTLEPPLGSGPYKIKELSPGKFITYELNDDYWARDLPVNKGRYNFKTIRIDYYQSQDIIREALKSGNLDFFRENTAKKWATTYTDSKAIKNGYLIKELIPDNTPQGLQAFVFNTRLDIFKDRRVRLALNYAFDFEWANKTFFYNSYIRSKSYFNNSEFSATKLPSAGELNILNQFRGKVPPEVFSKVFTVPRSDGRGENRKNLRLAAQLLKEAGWVLKQGKLVHGQTGEEFKFEILLVLEAFDRIINPYIQNLKKLGISARSIILKPAQYQKRVREFDFGMISGGFGQSNSPGNEQRDFWSSQAADRIGSRNTIGIKNPVIDELVEGVIKARSRDELILSVKALDRVLLWNYYVIPAWYYPYYRILYSSKIKMPQVKPKFDLSLDSWWIDTARERELKNIFN